MLRHKTIWDRKVQAVGINPYRYCPAHDALVALRDAANFPHINRADYAVTIYPPIAEFFFLVATRIGENVTVMRLGLLACEAVSVTAMGDRQSWPHRRLDQRKTSAIVETLPINCATDEDYPRVTGNMGHLATPPSSTHSIRAIYC